MCEIAVVEKENSMVIFHWISYKAVMFKYIVLLSVVLAVSQAIVCPPDFCSRVDCEDLTDCLESNGQKVREKGSYCNCCDICVKVLGENEACVPESDFLGVIITSECATGLFCDPSLKVCIRPAA
ncbi:uncharacterized protein TNCT_158121 [Trichonephila clavata]|uniref:Uncharacterized protein n=1 Tax=Trichonephila clavata TaxID=2740835 RepID=A0A8X6JKG1_TRICU|nr:uncharacterized protein TNCT_158121 [Trichonephila clavata]